jgi:cysteine desulfurase
MAVEKQLDLRVSHNRQTAGPEYLDMAATTPVSPRVAQVVMHFLTEEFGNAGSRTHAWGLRAADAVVTARAELAGFLSARPDELVFTSGATESDNLAILGLAEHGRSAGRMHLLSSVTEHKAVLAPLRRLAEAGFEVELLSPGSNGRFDADDVLAKVRPDTLLVSLMHVNNETGVIQPVDELARELCHTPTYFHVDAAQSFAKVEPDLLRGPIDMVSFSGHKIGAPKGIGALLVRRRRSGQPPLRPLIVGGGQEGGLRAGTAPVALIMGLLEAARERHEGLEAWTAAAQLRRREILDWAAAQGGIVNGDPSHTAPHIVNVCLPGKPSDSTIAEVADRWAVAAGSACTSAVVEPSHVLLGMGYSPDRAATSVRISW